MDLSTLIPKDDTLVVELKHPTKGDVLLKDDGKPMTVTVYGPHSTFYKQVIYDQQDARIKRAQKKIKQDFTAKDFEELTINLLAKTTKDWDIQIDGKTPKFSEEAAKDIYAKLPWVKVQVLELQEDFDSFLTS